MHVERFAPSPTGPLHLGHAFSALTAYARAQEAAGEFLLRIEDIDLGRARPEWERLIFEDLSWLGLTWPMPVLRQSTRLPAYRAALQTLWNRGLLYPCTCTRADIAAASAPQEGGDPIQGPDGVVYPGICRDRHPRGPEASMPADTPLRLDMRTAVPGPLRWTEDSEGPVQVTPRTLVERIGDVVLARRDMGTSYHLAVVVDDAHQDITHVTRGQDLREATAIHRLLQHLLDLPAPVYHHHRLIRDEEGKRLAKRNDARAIRRYREDGASPADIRAMVGL